jgi:hypothetical protein
VVIHVSQAFVIASDLIRLPEQRISATGRTVARIMAPMARLKAKSADAAPASGPADRGAHDLLGRLSVSGVPDGGCGGSD